MWSELIKYMLLEAWEFEFMNEVIKLMSEFLKDFSSPAFIGFNKMAGLEVSIQNSFLNIVQLHPKRLEPGSHQHFKDWLLEKNPDEAETVLEKKLDLDKELLENLKSKGFYLMSGFGLIYLDVQAERKGVNPETGEPIVIPGRKKMHFFIDPDLEEKCGVEFFASLPLIAGEKHTEIVNKYLLKK